MCQALFFLIMVIILPFYILVHIKFFLWDEFIEHLLPARYLLKHFTYSYSFNPHNNTVRHRSEQETEAQKD